jgi:hypothetical protein
VFLSRPHGRWLKVAIRITHALDFLQHYRDITLRMNSAENLGRLRINSAEESPTVGASLVGDASRSSPLRVTQGKL